ncbi:MAG: efflux RND transporter permease subunit [Chloroflexota bacterium]|nr:efflux RND transporter permease subunit [Chloroflexota bacterium]
MAILPTLSFPEVTIITVDAGANPDTIETQVTKPIEDAVSTLLNIDTLTSTSTQGVSTVRVQFTTAANATLVGVDVERVVSAARSKLPTSADAPSIVKADTSSAPVLTVAVSGTQPLDQLKDIAENQVKRDLRSRAGCQLRLNGWSSDTRDLGQSRLEQAPGPRTRPDFTPASTPELTAPAAGWHAAFEFVVELEVEGISVLRNRYREKERVPANAGLRTYSIPAPVHPGPH